MKFLYSDSLDYVDPYFDFFYDQSASSRRPHADDKFAHEYLGRAPYDGLLISRAIVGGVQQGKYNTSQSMRFTREGARRFLRYDSKTYPGSLVMGDCGAFTYRNCATPPYSVESTIEFYANAGFTHGCSVDHVILDFFEDSKKPTSEARRRQEITIENAAAFLKEAKVLGNRFTPLGVVQGWSARSMAQAATCLVKMGYTYLALGGLVPLTIDRIERVLVEVRAAVPRNTRLHLLGFGKIDELKTVSQYNVTSFDTTSPLIRAFKDARRNYFVRRNDDSLDYYTAIRVPQALENVDLLRGSKRGTLNQDALLEMEAAALNALRDFGSRRSGLRRALHAVMRYGRYALWNNASSKIQNERRLQKFADAYTRTLRDRPWEQCKCNVCRIGGIETLIFRSSNRNKRRGIHNLSVFYDTLVSKRCAQSR